MYHVLLSILFIFGENLHPQKAEDVNWQANFIRRCLWVYARSFSSCFIWDLKESSYMPCLGTLYSVLNCILRCPGFKMAVLLFINRFEELSPQYLIYSMMLYFYFIQQVDPEDILHHDLRDKAKEFPMLYEYHNCVAVTDSCGSAIETIKERQTQIENLYAKATR